MKRFTSVMLACFLFVSTFAFAFIPSAAAASTSRQNTYPIILVHGLGGFDNLLGIPYWGGLYDVSKDLTARGYENYVVAIGPVSSNWDRACELYAEIKGGTVDYGKAHSEKYGHARFGRTYPGLYPAWDATHKINMIGHSMGGQTVRTLAQLLNKGDAAEIAASPNYCSPLFAGQQSSWVDGIITLSTPHDGSPLAYTLTTKGILQKCIVFLTAIAGDKVSDVYDLKLDQWGLTRKDGESCDDFLARVESSDAMKSTDMASYDLKPDGAMELNSWVKAQPDVYYFSQGTSCTFKELFTGHYLARIEMNPLFIAFADTIGCYKQTSPIVIDKAWWENDGFVSLNTANGPHIGSTDQFVSSYKLGDTPQKGKWQYLGTINNIDHAAVAGILTLNDQRPLFRSYAQLLGSLPQ